MESKLNKNNDFLQVLSEIRKEDNVVTLGKEKAEQVKSVLNKKIQESKAKFNKQQSKSKASSARLVLTR